MGVCAHSGKRSGRRHRQAGGYTIQASGSIGGGSTATATSLLFNVNGQ